MVKRPLTWPAIAASFLLLVTMSCAALEGAPTARPLLTTPRAVQGPGSNAAGISGNSGNSGGQSSNGTPTLPTPTLPPSATPTLPTPSPTPSPLPNPDNGPFVVKQIQTLGHETIQGLVCNITKPFVVNAATPQVSWTFNFVPIGASKGNLSYAYTISSAGESHSATGTYTLSPYEKAGALLLTMTVRDHVVFKGFDGTMPVSYKFALTPTGHANCP